MPGFSYIIFIFTTLQLQAEFCLLENENHNYEKEKIAFEMRISKQASNPAGLVVKQNLTTELARAKP